MRIILLNQYYAPDEAATAQLLGDLGAALVRAGHQVTAICCDRSYAELSRRYPAEETIDGVRVRRVRSTAFGRRDVVGRLADYVTFMAGAALRLLTTRADVVVSLTTPPLIALLGSTAAHLRREKSIFWSMDVYPEVAFALGALRPRSLAGRLFRRLSRATLRSNDTVVALGESMGARLEAGGARHVEVIHNWSEDIEPVPPELNRLRRQWGWGSRFVVLYSGNLGLAHEFDTVLGAAALLRREPDILFAFVGGGPRMKETAARSRELGLTNVEFRPYVARELLGESLSAGDVHLVTLRPGMEGLLVPSKIYGILAAARPVRYVGPAAGEVFDIIEEGECGIRIENGDAKTLAEVLRADCRDRRELAAAGTNARALYERRFTKVIGTTKFVELIESLADRELRIAD